MLPNSFYPDTANLNAVIRQITYLNEMVLSEILISSFHCYSQSVYPAVNLFLMSIHLLSACFIGLFINACFNENVA